MRFRPSHVIALISVSILLASTAACGGSSSDGSPGSAREARAEKDAKIAAIVPDSVKKSGVIRIATDATYPPFTSMANDGKTVVGLDADLGRAISDTLGLEAKFVNTSFDAIIPALAAKKVDMGMSSIGDTKEREAVVDFATYYWNGTMLLVADGNPKKLSADKACGVRVGVIRGSLQQSTFLPAQGPVCEKAGLEAPTANVYQSGPQAQLALKSGRIEAVMEDAPPVLEAAKKTPKEFDAVGPLTRNPNPGGVALPKGSKLADPVTRAINKLIKDGTYAAILKEWDLSQIAIDRSKINGAKS